MVLGPVSINGGLLSVVQTAIGRSIGFLCVTGYDVNSIMMMGMTENKRISNLLT